MDRSIEDQLPFARSPKARFPGDRGRGADVPLDTMPKPMEMVPQDTGMHLRQLKPPKSGPRMPQDVKQPPLVQNISSPGEPIWNPQDYPNIPPPPGSGPLAPPPPPVAGASPERTGIMRTLLGPGGPESRAKGGVSPFAAIARMLGAEETTAQKAGQFEQSLQASLAMPWASGAGAGAMGIRALQGAGLGAAEGTGEGVKGMGTRALTGAGTSLGGDLAAKGLRYVGSAIPHKLFSGKTAGELGNWLRQNVPAWAGFKGNRALYEMAREGGQAKLNDAFATAFVAAKDRIPKDTLVPLTVQTAKSLRFPVSPEPSGIGAAAQMAQRFSGGGVRKAAAGKLVPDDLIEVNARELLEKLPGLKDQALRRQVLDTLSDIPGAVPEEALRAYKTGSGFMDFAKKSGLFKQGEAFDASLAQKGLREVGKETLERRGMGDIRNIIRGPLSAPPIKRETGRTAGTLIGGALGSLGGAQTLGGGLGTVGGATGGALAGGFLGQRLPLYRNVPETIPQIGQIRRSLLQALTQQMLQNQRSAGQ